MNYKERFYPESKIGGFTDIDGTITFFTRVNALLDSAMVVLDVGCGRGAGKEDSSDFRRNLRSLKGKVRKVIGIDVDPDAKDNPFIDEYRQLESNDWPLDESSVDLIVCDNVMEHIEFPDLFFSEAKRVLKNGGYLCIRTPNTWNYVSLMARIIPNKYHSKVTATVQEGRKDEDVFPTVFRCNSLNKMRRLMQQNNFEHVVYGYEPEPGYLSFSFIAYFLGVLHQRFAPKCFKPVLFAFGTCVKGK